MLYELSGLSYLSKMINVHIRALRIQISSSFYLLYSPQIWSPWCDNNRLRWFYYSFCYRKYHLWGVFLAKYDKTIISSKLVHNILNFYLTATTYCLFQLTMSLNSSALLNEENSQEPKRNTEGLERLELQTPSSFQDNPLQQLQLASQEVLEKAKKSGRSKCPRCSSSRMFYCYTCFVPVETVPTKEIPTVKVNVLVDFL